MSPEYECPYCGHGSNEVDDMYETETSYETECSNCEKVFHVTVEYSASYETHTDEVEKQREADKKARDDRMKNFRI